MYCHLRSVVSITLLSAILVALPCRPALAVDQTVGLFQYDQDRSYEGYTLLYPLQHPDVYLLDNYGRVVHFWDLTGTPTSAVYLLPNGHLLRGGVTYSSGTQGQLIQEIAWDGSIVWSFDYTSTEHRQHHDIEPLDNGNILLLANENFTAAEAHAAGRDPSLLNSTYMRSDYVAEIMPVGDTGEIVWEWHMWDHLVQEYDAEADNYGHVADHPELLNINYAPNKTFDWPHCNSVDYNAELDQIVISSRHFSEMWIIDHSTTRAEAASHSGGHYGHGGDILYRWGNPLCYDSTTSDTRKLYGPHDIHWIKDGLEGAGHILLFNNGWQRPDSLYSTADELILPVKPDGSYPTLELGASQPPEGPTWRYTADPPTSCYSPTISGAQRLPNGNTLVCSGHPGRIFEVTAEGNVVWEYQSPVALQGLLSQGASPSSGVDVFRCQRYAPDCPGLAGRDLTPGAPVELYDVTVAGTSHQPEAPGSNDLVVVSSRVWSANPVAEVTLHVSSGGEFQTYPMYDDGQHKDGVAGDSVFAAELPAFIEGTLVSYYVQAEDQVHYISLDPPCAPDNATYSFTVHDDYVCGDMDFNGTGPDIADLVYLVSYMFQDGPEPVLIVTTDVNGDGTGPDITDLVYLVTYMFQDGPALQCP